MSKTINKAIKPVEITLLGKTFSIACPPDQEIALLAAAEYLQEKMRFLKESGRVTGMERIAVLAALNITHELLSACPITEDNSELLSEKVEKLQQKVDSALVSVGQLTCVD